MPSLHRIKCIYSKRIVSLHNGGLWSAKIYFHYNLSSPHYITSSRIVILVFWHYSHGLYNTRPLLALSRPLLALSRAQFGSFAASIVTLGPLLHSHDLYMTFSHFSGSLQALCWRYNNLRVSTGTPTISTSTFMASTSPLVMVCISPFDFYKQYLTTSTHSHEFYNTLTASIGTFMTSTVTRTASFYTLTACTGFFGLPTL